MNIKEICDYIHNYFEVEEVTGEFSITDGSLVTSILSENQYFRIQGSIFNDGIYQYPTDKLIDETFNGIVTPMAVPPDVIKVMEDAKKWEEDNAKVLQSPLNSESFGGYSYSKGTSSRKDGSQGQVTWRDVFGDKLKAYRKIG